MYPYLQEILACVLTAVHGELFFGVRGRLSAHVRVYDTYHTPPRAQWMSTPPPPAPMPAFDSLYRTSDNSALLQRLEQALSPPSAAFRPERARESPFTLELLALMNGLRPEKQTPTFRSSRILSPHKLRSLLRDKVDRFGRDDQQVGDLAASSKRHGIKRHT